MLTTELPGSVICEAGLQACYSPSASTLSLKGSDGKSHLHQIWDSRMHAGRARFLTRRWKTSLTSLQREAVENDQFQEKCSQTKVELQCFALIISKKWTFFHAVLIVFPPDATVSAVLIYIYSLIFMRKAGPAGRRGNGRDAAVSPLQDGEAMTTGAHRETLLGRALRNSELNGFWHVSLHC